jgi:hypothetical protein
LRQRSLCLRIQLRQREEEMRKMENVFSAILFLNVATISLVMKLQIIVK